MFDITMLPLQNGAWLWDNSRLEYLVTCPRSALYSVIRKRKLATEKDALLFGGHLHDALEVRYTGAPAQCTDAVHTACNKRLVHAFEQRPTSVGSHRNLEYAMAILDYYNNVIYQNEDFSVPLLDNKPMVEMPFMLDLCDIYLGDTKIPIKYIGRIDLTALYNGREVWTVDHKTTSIFGDNFIYDQRMSPQHRGYCWALWKLTGEVPTGYVVNSIRIRPPAKSRSIVEPDDFYRHKEYITLEAIQEWEANTIDIFAELAFFLNTNRFPMHRKWCVGKYGRCPFYDVCSMPQQDRESLLTSTHYTTDEWSPLDER